MAVPLSLLLLIIYGSIKVGEASTNTTGQSTGRPETSTDDLDLTQDHALTYTCLTSFENHTCVESGRVCNDYPVGEYYLCHCDDLCVKYNDCCLDVADSCPTAEPITNTMGAPVETITSGFMSRLANPRGTFQSPDGLLRQKGRMSAPEGDYTECIQTLDFYSNDHMPRLGHRLISRCPADWQDTTGILKMCQTDIGFVSSIQATPVIDPNNHHYKNVFCAICHGVAPEEVTYWITSFLKKNNVDLGFVDITSVVHLDELHTVRQHLRRVLKPFSQRGTGRGEDPPPMRSPRSCVLVDVTSCSLITDRGEDDPCQGHFAPGALNGTTYRNLFCVECDLSLSESEVDNLRDIPCVDLSAGRDGMSMASIMIFSDRAEVTLYFFQMSLSDVISCSSTQVYDPYLELCRDLICPSGHTLSENGAKCSKVQTSSASTGLSIEVEIKLTITGSLLDGQSSVQNSITTWDTIARKSADDFMSSALLKDKGENNLPRRNGSFCDDFNITWVCSSVDPGTVPSWDVCTPSNAFRCYVNVSFNCDAPPTDRLMSFNHIVQDTCFQGGFWKNSIRLDAFKVVTPCNSLSNESRNTMNSSDYRSTRFSEKTLAWDDSFGEFKETNFTEYCEDSNFDCPLLKYSKSDYVIIGPLNDSIKLIGYYEVIFHNGEYKLLDNGDVEVCSFLPQRAPSSDAGLGSDELAHLILTVTGSSVSLVGLMVTITTYIAFPALRRNVAGKSLMSLVASLFFAQATLLIGFNMNHVFELCRAFAIGGHFFWLSAFFWMNLLAIDIYRTFGVGTRLKNANTNNRSFWFYALYGCGSPTMIVGVCVILSSCNCVDLDIHYGKTEACWLGGGTANLVAFGAPVALIICINAVLFSLTIIGVKITRRASGKMNITQGQGCSVKRANSDLFLYVKLSAIMGFTWIFGFIASLFNIPAFWYPYIVLNSLQGALVCLAFVCNRRVIAMWRMKLGLQIVNNSSSNSSSSRPLKKSFQSTPILKISSGYTNFAKERSISKDTVV